MSGRVTVVQHDHSGMLVKVFGDWDAAESWAEETEQWERDELDLTSAMVHGGDS